MKNLWLTRNPYLSLWMSGANKAAATARGHAAAATRREAAQIYRTATSEATRQIFDFWVEALGGPRGRRRRK